MIDFDKLDKIIHEKGRLSIMTLLSSRGTWNFQDKELKGRKVTNYFLTAKGKKSFNRYLNLLEKIVKQGGS